MSSGACEYGRMDAKTREKSSSRQTTSVLDTRSAADFLGVSARTLEGFRVRGGGPRFVKIGGSVRYRLASLEEYLRHQERTSTSDPGPGDSARRGGRG
jgi:predicted DNA-binding transcriptional regulator AlpA